MKLRAYLVDDEALALTRLDRLLRAGGRVEVVGKTTDPEDALAFLQAHDVDVLFLDIAMPGMNGFELCARLAETPPVVFTTAYDRHALEAFTVNSVAYLLKPIDPARLAAALDKLERLRRDVLERLAAALAQRAPARPVERLASRVGGRVLFVELDRVSHIFAEDKLTWAAAEGKTFVLDQTIAELEQRLDPARFVRIHRGTIVQLAFVKELDGNRLRLKDGTNLQVSRDRLAPMKERLGV